MRALVQHQPHRLLASVPVESEAEHSVSVSNLLIICSITFCWCCCNAGHADSERGAQPTRRVHACVLRPRYVDVFGSTSFERFRDKITFTENPASPDICTTSYSQILFTVCIYFSIISSYPAIFYQHMRACAHLLRTHHC